MPQHRFHGYWSYFEMPDGASVPTAGRRMFLAIPNENGLVDEDNSRHEGHPVDGEVSNTRADLERKQTGNLRKLTGTVVFDQRCGEEAHIVIVGTFKDEDTKLDQNEGTWIITKP